MPVLAQSGLVEPARFTDAGLTGFLVGAAAIGHLLYKGMFSSSADFRQNAALLGTRSWKVWAGLRFFFWLWITLFCGLVLGSVWQAVVLHLFAPQP